MRLMPQKFHSRTKGWEDSLEDTSLQYTLEGQGSQVLMVPAMLLPIAATG